MKLVSILENQNIEKRIAVTPETAKKYISFGIEVLLQKNYGSHLGFDDSQYQELGVEIINDENLTGSDGKVKITLRDNGRGGLYRCDASTVHPQWANVGNIFYEEGLAFIKSPVLTMFGKDKFETKFKGQQDIHVSTINVHVPAGMMNSSSNPGYQHLSASESPADIGERFVYIDSLNIHDENLNVIMRGTLAQPIKKRVKDDLVIRFKMDF